MAEYVFNQILFSSLTQRFYFVRKAKVRGDGILEVVGKKVDVTESIQPFLAKKYRAKETTDD